MGQLKDWGCLNCKRNSMKIKSLSSAKFQRARAEELVLLVFFERAGGQAPQLWEAWPSARARARALSTNQNFKITTFLLVNFKNDHGKSCSVSRDWQPPKISAQCVPISQSNDQKPISFNFKERISAQFSHHFLIFFADIPLPRPPSLSAVPKLDLQTLLLNEPNGATLGSQA